MKITPYRVAVGCLVLLGVFGVTIFALVMMFVISDQKGRQEWVKFHQEQRKKRTAETVGTITNFKSSRTGQLSYS